jgi:rod shape determining protein RodA
MFSFKNNFAYKILLFPWSFLIGIFGLIGLGGLSLYSCGNGHLFPWLMPQMMRVGMGFVLMMGLSFVPLKFYFRYAYHIYIFSILVLLAVFFLGTIGMGAKRWLNFGVFKMQPSELVKLSSILLLARLFSGVRTEGVMLSVLRPWKTYIIAFFAILIPAFFIARQPDLGTALVLIAIFIMILFGTGFPLSFFSYGAVVIATVSPLLWFFLKDYQKNRVLTFLNPERDPFGAGYHILQSKIALGSGRFWGKGFLKGTQNHLDFLPEKQTDFIFTSFCEEFGFVGGLVLLGFCVFLLFQGIRAILRAQSYFSYILALGMNCFLFLHFVVNIAMVMGLLPIVGVPLPFLSYGGSSLLTFMMGYGLLFATIIDEQVHLPYSEWGGFLKNGRV